MSLLLIMMVGALCGWLVGTVAHVLHLGSVAGNMGIGAAGAFITGGLAGHEALLGGLTGTSLLGAALGAMALLLVVNLSGPMRRR